ncbi:MAG TPA: hypothetical protein VN131_05655, partial [Mobilitalea sp.]|nr:hypothetical protein [Mobilitalea sp.]
MKKEELKKAIDKQQELENEQETYLASLKQQSKYYTEQLGNLEQMWTDCKLLFQDMVTEITKIAGEGYFSVEDLNLNIGFTKMEGSIYEDTFNTILKKHSKLTETIFTFYDGYIVIEVLDKHLSLTGNFVIEGDSAIRFVPSKGSFYDMPLEQSSLAELFENGPLLIDFKKMAGDMLTIDFTIEAVESHDGYLSFTVKPEF